MVDAPVEQQADEALRRGSDSRIESALAWCFAREIKDVTVVVPFPVAPDVVARLLSQRRVLSLVVAAEAAPDAHDERVGELRPAQYSWRMPRATARSLVFIGPGTRIAAPMLRAALGAGVRSIQYWDIDRWTERSIWLLLAAKVSGRLGGLARPVLDRSIVHLPSLADAHFRRGFAKALRATSTLGSGPATPNRVVIVCPTLVAGGAERQILNTVTGLSARGWTDLTILVCHLHSPPGNDFFLPPLAAAGVQVREPSCPTDNLEDWDRYHQGTELPRLMGRIRAALAGLPPSLLQDVVNLYLELTRLRPSVVHCWLDYANIRGGLAALLAGVPRVILSGRNVGPVHFPYILQPYMRAAYQVMATRPEVCLVNNSRGGAEDYAAWLDLPPDRLRVIYNGAHMSWLRRPSETAIRDFLAGFGIVPGTLVVGGMFRFSDEKRPLLWLETAMRILGPNKRVHCLLFGTGPLESEMRDRVAASVVADRIQLVEPTNESATALAAFDVLLLTSRWEGTPNVAIEAQALGTPVVATGGGGVRETFDSGRSGLYVAEPTAAGLARAVNELLDDPERRAAMAKAGSDFVRDRFALDRMIAETLDLYDRG